jgi:hypothetical protein
MEMNTFICEDIISKVDEGKVYILQSLCYIVWGIL